MSLCRSPWARTPRSAVRELRPRGRRVGQLPGDADSRVREQPPFWRVDHDHAAAGSLPAWRHLRQLLGALHLPRGAGGDDERLPGRLVLDLGVDPPSQVERERHLERDNDQQQHVRERGQQLQAETHSTSSGDEKRKPTPRTVCM